jgi:hypothetical protein
MTGGLSKRAQLREVSYCKLETTVFYARRLEVFEENVQALARTSSNFSSVCSKRFATFAHCYV